jgi:carbamoyltransferase
MGRDSSVAVEGQVFFPHSLGIFYQAITQFLGFPKYDLHYFRHARDRIDYTWDQGEPIVGTLFTSELQRLLGPARKPEDDLTQRHRDIARSTQIIYEEIFFRLLNRVHARHGSDQLALSGGCAMNSVANGKITVRTPFRQIYVQSAAGDAGGAIGAAFAAWSRVSSVKRRFIMDSASWGPRFSTKNC